MLAPPAFDGLTAEALRARLRTAASRTGRTRRSRPRWATCEIHADGTVAPWLTRERHRAIVEQHARARAAAELYAQVECPALLLVAGEANPAAAEAAGGAAAHAELVAFPGGDHDLHAQHPDEVAAACSRRARRDRGRCW